MEYAKGLNCLFTLHDLEYAKGLNCLFTLHDLDYAKGLNCLFTLHDLEYAKLQCIHVNIIQIHIENKVKISEKSMTQWIWTLKREWDQCIIFINENRKCSCTYSLVLSWFSCLDGFSGILIMSTVSSQQMVLYLNWSYRYTSLKYNSSVEIPIGPYHLVSSRMPASGFFRVIQIHYIPPISHLCGPHKQPCLGLKEADGPTTAAWPWHWNRCRKVRLRRRSPLSVKLTHRAGYKPGSAWSIAPM